jgi:hypothetical protein
MVVSLTPSWYLGVCRDQPSGDAVLAWGLDATLQLAAGQVVSSPVCTVVDQGSGLDVSATLLSGTPSLAANDAGTANMVIVQALTNAVKGALYRLKAEYVPSPPSPGAEKAELVLDFLIVL